MLPVALRRTGTPNSGVGPDMAEQNQTGLVLISALFLGLVGFLGAIKRAGANLPGDADLVDLDALYRKHGRLKAVDPALLKAIAQVESDEQPQAKNPLDPSWGLMQILCSNDGLDSPCKNRFPAVPGWEGATPNRLTSDVDFNVHVGSTILAWNLQRYGFPKGIAVYNSWGARNDPIDGPFRNQVYVDRVLGKLAGLRNFK